MNSKPIKGTTSKPNTIISLQQKIEKLQIQIKRLQVKNLKIETKMLKQEQKMTIIQAENKKLKEKINTPLDRAQLHADIAAIKGLKHDEPPKK
jgi:TolA-binding protein